MRYVNIPKTDLNPSILCMGGGPLSFENQEDRVFDLLDTFYDLGGNIIDSANVYGKWLPSGKNVCDINIGRWLSARGLRDEIIVTSKGAHPPLSNMTQSRLEKSDVAFDIEESLSALKTDYIDLYYLHRDDPDVPVEEVVDYLNDFVKEGKIRYFAASNWEASRIEAAQSYATKAGKQGFSANQLMWSFAIPDMSNPSDPTLVNMDEASKEYHEKSGLAAVAYESQASGFFHKYARRDSIDMPKNLSAKYGSSENIQRYERAAELAHELDMSLTQIILGYILSQSFVSIAIIGSRNKAQLKDSMEAGHVKLTPEQVRYLETGEN